MPVPNSMADLATLASSNFPTGTESIGNNLDNYLRSHGAIIRSTNAVASATIASASTTDIGSADGEFVIVTGAATINSLGSGFPGCRREVQFQGVCTLVNSASILLPNGANVVTAAGDVHSYRCTSSGVWKLTALSRVRVSDVAGLQDSLDGKVGKTGGQSMIGASLYISYTAPLGAAAGSVSTVLTNQINTGNTDELQFTAVRRATGSTWDSAVQKISRVIDGSAIQGYIEFNGGSSGRSLTVGVGTTELCWSDRNGDFTTLGTLISLSDERLKTDWRQLDSDLPERLALVKCGSYRRTDTGETQIGVSAQSLRSAIPDAVLGNENGTLSVAYGNAALVASIAVARRLIELERIVSSLGSR